MKMGSWTNVIAKLLILFIVVIMVYQKYVSCGYCSYYTTTSYTYNCGWWGWRSCRNYKQRAVSFCCPGYYKEDCNLALCAGIPTRLGACNHISWNDAIYYRNGHSRDRGGGTCVNPNVCKNCKDGFYENGQYCTICPKIANCNHRRCNNTADNYCEWCKYEIKDKPYWRAYSRHKDGQMKQCHKTCSWRSDSTRCYPGNCTDEVVESCVCTEGFGGDQCDRITEETSILYAEIKLHTPTNEILTLPADPNYPGSEPIKFTKNANFTEAEIEFHAKYVASGTPPAHDPDGEKHYVTDFRHGIIHGYITIDYLRYTPGENDTQLQYSCPGNEDQPINVNYNCSRLRTNSSQIILPIFKHGDQLVYTLKVRNGGYLTYINKETNTTIRSSLNGLTSTRKYIIQWDYVNPYYICLEDFGINCTVPPLILQDSTNNSVIPIYWKQWTDNLAGVEYYEYEIFDLEYDGTSLTEGRLLISSDRIPFTETQNDFNVTTPGMYSIIFTVFDRADNHKSHRSVFLYDNESIVDTTTGTRIIVTESTPNTNYTWVVENVNEVTVNWSGRFRNERHHIQHWLEQIAPNKHIDSLYDDSFGIRTTDCVTNVQGVVGFDISYTVTGPDLTYFQEFTNVDDILQEAEVINVVWEDGQKLDIFIKAIDILEEYIIDTVTVFKDTTAAVIENFGLTRHDKKELFIHNSEEFTDMTIEWLAYDYHSGIHNVHWQLYDNFTGEDILHGHSHLIAQGNAENMTECEEKYNSYPRGSDCYCTFDQGCFHSHFHVRPKIVNGSGLTLGKDKGVHNSDYFIEITVVNKAMLTTVLTKKISIDLSAPNVGFVNDGLVGSPEIDYQQNRQLNVYWEGFFDPESGVKYYKYAFAGRCLLRQDLINGSVGTETTNTFASYHADSEGTYFVSVVAVNSANEASSVVCSDGVTITTETPFVKDVLINDIRSVPRLISDKNNTIWYLDESIKRHPLYNNHATCGNPVVYIDDVHIYEVSKVVDIQCENLQTRSSMFMSVLPRASQLLLNWKPGINDTLIYDYEIGLSTTKHSPAPDIVPFTSANHNNHFRLNNPDLHEGEIFYIVIKTITKSDVQNIQSVGPIIIDSTAPRFNGSPINVWLEDDFLVANWSSDSFYDDEDPNPLIYEYSLGHCEYSTDVRGDTPLTFDGSCKKTIPPKCTAIPLSSLHWSLHENHDYYVTIKVTNLAGLSIAVTSSPYTHDTKLPVAGVVYDIDPQSLSSDIFEDIRDIDFTNSLDSLAVKWTPFYHPYLSLHYKICVGTMIGYCDVTEVDHIDASVKSYRFKDITLIVFKKYFIMVEGVSKAGNVSISTDGVTVLDNKTQLGIRINDGHNVTENVKLKNSHHDMNVAPAYLDEDIDFQRSTATLEAYWKIPSSYSDIITSTVFGIEKKSPVGDYWSEFQPFSYIGNHHSISIGDLNLNPGITYRIKVKVCAGRICFPPDYSTGVTVIPNKPVTGGMVVDLYTGKIVVTIERMYDPDIEDEQEAVGAVDTYKWSITDNNKAMYTKWTEVVNSTYINNTHISFEIFLLDEISDNKCKKLFVRGINKAGVSAEVSADIKTCFGSEETIEIKRKNVIDAIGNTHISSDHEYGKGIDYTSNTDWTEPDIDYIPFTNVISAVWPTLRHKSFVWGVIEVLANSAERYYKSFTDIEINDPCSHPDVISCGYTDKEFINVYLNKSNILQHGHRYIVCVHAQQKEFQSEKWKETLPEINSCSDGVTVDLTPPSPGNVWIGTRPNIKYLTSSTDLYVTWDSFLDVEEHDKAMHSTGIAKYEISVGSTEDGVDIIDYMNVGITNHVSFHDLRLQNGHYYYTKITAYDFLNRSTSVKADAVKIDVTSPEITGKSITIEGRHLTNLSEIFACWTDVFIDKESGMSYYNWGIGSYEGQDDVLSFIRTAEDCGTYNDASLDKFSEGHPYIITIKGFNNAGLMAMTSSWAYIFDISQPVAGRVYDGHPDAVSAKVKDIDYQENMNTLSAHWEGFHDPHTVIKNYFVHIGLCRGCDDVLLQQYTGIHNRFTLLNIHLKSGFKYYTTVTACNTADMCSSATSDGVLIDNSPPTDGLVQDGTGDSDIEYQSVRNHIAAKWHGFVDSQSGIDRYVIRAGTIPGLDDLVPSTVLSATDIFVLTDVVLPINNRIYITVRAYNKAGLFSEATSNGFLIDTSAPFILQEPTLIESLGSVLRNSIIMQSVLKVEWTVEDKESFIERQYISIATHSGGEFNTKPTKLGGVFREYTYTGLDLHDGGIYSVKLIVCNGAKICVETESDKILVDSSPPTPGMFAVKTQNAAELKRHREDCMTWSHYRLHICWLGFSDVHSGIDSYFVSVGMEYMADDLNKIPGKPMQFYHNESSIHYKDEGPVQNFIIQTQKISDYQHIFISVWAVNKVGLWSSMIHSQFQLIPGGYLDLIRRCSALSCIGHCVCSPRNSHCSLNGDICNDVSTDNKNTIIEVTDITYLTSHTADGVKFTPSNCFLAAQWKIVRNQGLKPKWYEWSVGLTSKGKPEGIINSQDENVWRHSGQKTEAVYNLKKGTKLKEMVTYSVFVRVWYDNNIYAVFKSHGITVLSSPPVVNDLQGVNVVEKLPGSWRRDVDFIKAAGSLFEVSWKNVFLSMKNSIKNFHVYLSTFPGGSDLHTVDVELIPTNYAFNVSRLDMKPGVRYYSNVLVSTFSGPQTLVSSNGITVDSSPPVAGIVYDGIGLHDLEFQNKSDIISANWHGFTDNGCSIIRYHWCVGDDLAENVCNVLDWTDVGMHTRVSTKLPTHIPNGSRLYNKVNADDCVGHTSSIVTSDGVTIDITAPVPVKIEPSNENLVMNPSFENTGGSYLPFTNISSSSLCSNDISVMPESWYKSYDDDCVATLRSDVNTAYKGRSFVFIRGKIHQTIKGMIPGEVYRISFVTSHAPQVSSILSNTEGIVTFGDVEHIFLIYTKDRKHGEVSSNIFWHQQSFNFKAMKENINMSIGNLDSNIGLLVDYIRIQKMDKVTSDTNKVIHVNTVDLHQWSSIHAAWYFEDSESPIVEYLWAIGYTEGSTEIQGFTSVGVNTFGFNYNVTLIHSSTIHVTVVAVNAAGLSAKSHSTSFFVDLTPPEILYVNDGTGSEVDGQVSNVISTNWNARDPDSEIEFCEWSVGFQPYGNELLEFTKTADTSHASAKFHTTDVSGRKVYVTIRCHNSAGLHVTTSSDGVVVSDVPPSSEHAVVEIIPRSLTEYTPRNLNQGDNKSIRMKWSGFFDTFGVMSFNVKLTGNNKKVTTSILNTNNGVTHLSMTGLNLPDDIYTADVTAVNSMYLRSTDVSSNMTICTSPVLVTGIGVSISNRDGIIFVSWKGCFRYPGHLMYEVSVGSSAGGADVIQWQETLNDFMELQIPDKFKDKSDLTLYFYINGIGDNGENTFLNADISV